MPFTGKKLGSFFQVQQMRHILSFGCVAGLMARVAFSDMVIEKQEVEQMKKSLGQFAILDEEQTSATVQIALEDVKSLCGIENYMYTDPLSTMLTSSQRFNLLKALFKIAASDGVAEDVESEEIRLITKGPIVRKLSTLLLRGPQLQKNIGGA